MNQEELCLPFWYCGKCKKQLDFRDPAQNIPLLKYLTGVKLSDLLAEYGDAVFERIYSGHFQFEIVND